MSELPERVSVKVQGYRRGRVFLDGKVVATRRDDGEWQPPKKPGWDFDTLLRWLMAHQYVFAGKDPHRPIHTGTAVQVYHYERKV